MLLPLFNIQGLILPTINMFFFSSRMYYIIAVCFRIDYAEVMKRIVVFLLSLI
jgi:hypothetical protein